jgi:hypothetical protein
MEVPADEGVIRCTECDEETDEFGALADRWVFWSDGGNLLPYRPTCSEREFGAPETAPTPLAHPRALTNGGSSS